MNYRHLLLPMILGVAGFGCSQKTTLTVANDSSATLTKIEAFGTGFRQRVRDLPPGASERVPIGVIGEAGVSLTFDANGKHYALPEEGYLEHGYEATISVSEDFKLKLTIQP